MKPNYKEGDLVTVVRQGSFTLCRATSRHPPTLRECPVKELEVYSYPEKSPKKIFEDIEGKIGLIVYVKRNRLDQPVGFRVLIEGQEMFCKSKVADKYFKLTETQGDESR